VLLIAIKKKLKRIPLELPVESLTNDFAPPPVELILDVRLLKAIAVIFILHYVWKNIENAIHKYYKIREKIRRVTN